MSKWPGLAMDQGFGVLLAAWFVFLGFDSILALAILGVGMIVLSVVADAFALFVLKRHPMLEEDS